MIECGMGTCSGTYIDEGFLAFDPDLQLCLGHVDHDVFAAQVRGYAYCNVEVLYRLGPFVG